VLDAVVAQTGGVPLALIEVARLLSVDQRAGPIIIAPALPIGPRLTSVYGERIAKLGVATRLALAVLAAAGSDPGPIDQALEALGVEPDVLLPAERAGVVQRRFGAFVFTHPLQRTAGLGMVGADELRLIHKALAAATPEGERQALHVAKAAPAPSEQVAARLVERAEDEFARRGAVAAASVWSQAAARSPHPALVANGDS
jgi:hypothetical protein